MCCTANDDFVVKQSLNKDIMHINITNIPITANYKGLCQEQFVQRQIDLPSDYITFLGLCLQEVLHPTQTRL